MSQLDPITARLEVIDKVVNGNGAWNQLEQFAHEMRVMFDTTDYGKDVKITTWPLDMVGKGSISFQITFMPEDVYMKMWADSGTYYIAFFKITEEVTRYGYWGANNR